MHGAEEQQLGVFSYWPEKVFAAKKGTPAVGGGRERLVVAA
jgi:hypothetical protein